MPRLGATTLGVTLRSTNRTLSMADPRIVTHHFPPRILCPAVVSLSMAHQNPVVAVTRANLGHRRLHPRLLRLDRRAVGRKEATPGKLLFRRRSLRGGRRLRVLLGLAAVPHPPVSRSRFTSVMECIKTRTAIGSAMISVAVSTVSTIRANVLWTTNARTSLMKLGGEAWIARPRIAY